MELGQAIFEKRLVFCARHDFHSIVSLTLLVDVMPIWPETTLYVETDGISLATLPFVQNQDGSGDQLKSPEFDLGYSEEREADGLWKAGWSPFNSFPLEKLRNLVV